MQTNWTDNEIKRCILREGLFVRRGMSDEAAETLAERCMFRDRDFDDRRACIECKHMQESGFCKATKQWAQQKDMFHRCHRFEWQVPRTN